MIIDFTIGDAIELKLGEKIYRTIVEDQVSPDTILVYAPIEKGRALRFSESDSIDAIFVLSDPQSGKYDVYTFNALIVGRELHDRIPMLKLKAVSECKRIQRRDFYRLNIVKPLLIERIEGEGSIEIITRDISAGGIMAVSPKKLPLDAEYLVYINIIQDSPIVLVSKVLSCESYVKGEGRYLIRFVFTNIDKKLQSDLIRQINQLQAIELRRRKYITSASYSRALKNYIDDELLDKFNIDQTFDRRLRYLVAFKILLTLIIVALFLMAKPSKHWFPFFGDSQELGWNVDALKMSLFLSSVLFVLSGLGIIIERIHYRGRKRMPYSLPLFLGLSMFAILGFISIITTLA